MLAESLLYIDQHVISTLLRSGDKLGVLKSHVTSPFLRKLFTSEKPLLGQYENNGVGTNFGVGVGEARAESGGRGSWGGDSKPSPPTRGFAGAL